MKNYFPESVFLFMFLLSAAFTSTAHADQFQGRVVGISDGDTIKVMRDGKAVKIRLAGIDCPEKAQPFGQKAKKAASDMAFKKTVTVQVESKDRYGRLVGRVILPDGRCLNDELVRLGLAWHYKRYSKSKKLAALEVEAREAGRGLWRDKNPVPPWSWRKGKRSLDNVDLNRHALVKLNGEAKYHPLRGLQKPRRQRKVKGLPRSWLQALQLQKLHSQIPHQGRSPKGRIPATQAVCPEKVTGKRGRNPSRRLRLPLSSRVGQVLSHSARAGGHW